MTDEHEADLREQFEDGLDILRMTDHTICVIRRPDTCVTIAFGPVAAELEAAADQVIGNPQRVDMRAV
jgi:hypothetical protein